MTGTPNRILSAMLLAHLGVARKAGISSQDLAATLLYVVEQLGPDTTLPRPAPHQPTPEPRDAWLSAHVAHQLTDSRRVRELCEGILEFDDGAGRRMREAMRILSSHSDDACPECQHATQTIHALLGAQAYARAVAEYRALTGQAHDGRTSTDTGALPCGLH